MHQSPKLWHGFALACAVTTASNAFAQRLAHTNVRPAGSTRASYAALTTPQSAGANGKPNGNGLKSGTVRAAHSSTQQHTGGTMN